VEAIPDLVLLETVNQHVKERDIFSCLSGGHRQVVPRQGPFDVTQPIERQVSALRFDVTRTVSTTRLLRSAIVLVQSKSVSRMRHWHFPRRRSLPEMHAF
jgi:hypothetical protein